MHRAARHGAVPPESNGIDIKRNEAKRKNFETRALIHLDNLYRTALYALDNESDAENLVQESFIRAYRSWDEGQLCQNCRVLLFAIMVKVLINEYKPFLCLSAATSSVDEIDGYLAYSRWANQRPTDDSGQAPFSAISKVDVKRAIRNLPDNIRLIIVLSMLEGFSYREIADIVGINLETVKSGLHQGRRLVQRELFDYVVCEGMCAMPADRVRSRRSG